MKRKIIIDTDPGQDDAVAILTALASPEDFDVLGIVVVAGNAGLEHTAKNALKIVELAGRTDVPVHAGSERPMRRTLRTAPHVHGETGLDGPDLPEPKTPLASRDGVGFLIETLRAEAPGTVTLCTLGPLTNIAAAFTKAPDIVANVREIVMMGGAYFEVGNITPTAEFNIYVDPHAADIVFQSGVPITMMPLDVTHGVLTTPDRMARIRGLGNRAGEAVGAMLRFSERFDLEKYGAPGAPLHDPTVIAWLLDASMFEGRTINVTVETESELTMGMTVADYWRITNRPKNVHFVRSVDADRFYNLLTERLARLP